MDLQGSYESQIIAPSDINIEYKGRHHNDGKIKPHMGGN